MSKFRASYKKEELKYSLQEVVGREALLCRLLMNSQFRQEPQTTTEKVTTGTPIPFLHNKRDTHSLFWITSIYGLTLVNLILVIIQVTPCTLPDYGSF